jgi:excinuclease ABC subunit B
MSLFKLHAPFQPNGDQPAAIAQLTEGFRRGERSQVLMGVTGSGKTFTMANVIAQMEKPALVISHNKTLAAQLYSEFKDFFPENAVEYFVSYYDYYQPEAYIPQRDIYIEKDASINDDLERLRLAATAAILNRQDVVVVASVSSIYGLGSPSAYRSMVLDLQAGPGTPRWDRDELLMKLVEMQYERTSVDLERGKFRVRGDVIEIRPSYEEKTALRIELFGDEIERIHELDSLTLQPINDLKRVRIFAARHFVVGPDALEGAVVTIQQELEGRLAELEKQNKIVEYQRLASRTRYDLEMLREVGYCKGIENYSRHFTGLKPGERPFSLYDYFEGRDFLLFVDESHVSIPQIGGMYNGDRARKINLVEHGFRLPSALDNRPMKFEEWETVRPPALFVSATPAGYELEQAGGVVVEQVIRPTGLIDPVVEIRPAGDQVNDTIAEIKLRIARHERTLVTTLTKRLAEDLSEFLAELGIACAYLHNEVQTIERTQIIRELREGTYDVLVGVNLLREGLDLPEVSLVAILDADKEGFLRSATSLIQTIGRCARNVNGRVILYADRMTDSINTAVSETERRRAIQIAWNTEHGITPETIQKAIKHDIEAEVKGQKVVRDSLQLDGQEWDRAERIASLQTAMLEAADALEFEKAASIRDEILSLKSGAAPGSSAGDGRARGGRKLRRSGGRKGGSKMGGPGR